MNAFTPQLKPARLYWIDIMKGLLILWIAFFHFFSAYSSGRYPWPLNSASFPSFLSNCAPASFPDYVCCIVEGVVAAIFQRGPQAVSVFIVLSGFSLTYALLKQGAHQPGWRQWYTARLLRLFPLYWAAHLIYVISPFVLPGDALDYRFVLSLLGDRVWPVDTMFYYLNPSWWFFGLLLELYIVFPVLFRLLQKTGPVKYFVLCCVITISSRYLLVNVLHAHGNFIQGAFFGARLWEFAEGMALAQLFQQRPEALEKYLFSLPVLLSGIILYVLGGYSYQPGFSSTMTDGLIGTGLFIMVAHAARVSGRVPALKFMLSAAGIYSYGIYLLHHPYVLYFGERLRGSTMLMFVISASVLIAIISTAALFIERFVNRFASLKPREICL
ncbi:MAG: acyltransferase [Pseudomonadota bacterium]